MNDVLGTGSLLREGVPSLAIAALPSEPLRPTKPWTGAAEAARAIEDVRSTMGRDLHAAHAAAIRLVTLLTPATPGEAPCLRGGLAPWQQRAVSRYIGDRLAEPLPVKQLAQQAGLSVSHFCRAFRQSFGASPHGHITRLRVQHAQTLMLTTADPLIQIALACGMEHQAQFSKLFRRVVGETPSAWRRRNSTGSEPWRRREPAVDDGPRASAVAVPLAPRAEPRSPP